MFDVDITKSLWNGKLPVSFVLSNSDSISSDKVSPLLILIPRITYFHLVEEKISAYFQKYISYSDSSKIWFSMGKKPLKTHYPVGLLYDILKGQKNITLPWEITVHYNNFPNNLIDVASEKQLESHFIYTIKEADYLKSRGIIVQSFKKEEIETLWAGVKNDNYDQFWSINRRLVDQDKMISETAGKCGSTGEGAFGSGQILSGFKWMPIRLYNVSSSETFKQRLIKPNNERGDKYKVSHIPSLFNVEIKENESWEVRTHGINLPHHTPLEWLVENMSYPDNFVHMIFFITQK